MESKGPLRADHNRTEDTGDLLSLTAKRFHFFERSKMKCRADPEPIHGFASLSQGNLDVANEVSLGRTSLGLFQIGADGCSRFQQLIDQSTYAWPLIESQGETRDSTPELKGTIANVLRAIRHARGVHASGHHEYAPVERQFRKEAFRGTQIARRPGAICILNFAF